MTSSKFAFLLTLILAAIHLIAGETAAAAARARTTHCWQPRFGSLIGSQSVNHQKSEFLMELRDFLGTLRITNEAWVHGGSFMHLPSKGLRELNPTTQQISSLTNVRPEANGHVSRRKHVILREIRWLLTSVDAACRLACHAGQLGPHSGYFVTAIAGLSRRFDVILSTVGVPIGQLPGEANCRESNTITANSFILRTEFTSLVLRDTFNALTRIHDVLAGCDVMGQHGVGHGVHLHCRHDSTFYDTLPFGHDDGFEILVPLDYYVNYELL